MLKMWPGGKGEHIWWTHCRGSLVTVRGQMAEEERKKRKRKGQTDGQTDRQQKRKRDCWLKHTWQMLHCWDQQHTQTPTQSWQTGRYLPVHSVIILLGSVHLRLSCCSTAGGRDTSSPFPSRLHGILRFGSRRPIFSSNFSTYIMVNMFCIKIQYSILYLSRFMNRFNAAIFMA